MKTFGDPLEIMGDFMQLLEITSKVILNKLQSQEVCFKGVCNVVQVRAKRSDFFERVEQIQQIASSFLLAMTL